jgi:hypothetical protein
MSPREQARKLWGYFLEYTQLLTKGKNLKGEVVARTEESAEPSEDEKWNHGTGFIA